MSQKNCYDYELHLHTSETSRCGKVPAAEMVRVYHRLGYSGFAVTDHFSPTLCEMAEREHPRCTWEQLVERYLRGYRAARAEGERLDFDVILGAEVRFPENKNDYLVYGLTEEFLLDPAQRNLHLLGIRRFFRRYGDTLLIVQAHPYRDGNRKIFGDCLHGVEALNLNQRHVNGNLLARRLAEKRGLLMTAGSDAHRPEDVGRGAVRFPRRVRDSLELAQSLRAGDYLWGAREELGGPGEAGAPGSAQG